MGTKGTRIDLKGINIIDYPNSDLKSEEMDFYLCANAKLAIVCTSGLAVIPAIFKTPILYTNTIPMGNSLPLQPGAITIPKLLFSKKYNRKLTFKESLDYPLGNAITNTPYKDNDIDVIDNISRYTKFITDYFSKIGYHCEKIEVSDHGIESNKFNLLKLNM